MIKTWQQRCEEHPDHQQGIVTQQMIQDRMQEEIDELRQALAQPEQEQKIKHSLAFCKSIQSRVYIGDEMVSFAKMTLKEAGLMPKREWVGLTDEESIAMLQKAAKHKSPDYCTAPEMAIEFGRLASETLKEKNGG